MTKNKNFLQISLIITGFALIVLTYFVYPSLKNNEKLTTGIIDDQKKEGDISKEKESSFDNVEYKGLYNIENPFSVKAEKANIINDEPDIVHMKKMKVTIFMKDGRTILITSDKGRYNKMSYDCYFESNVKATDGKTTLTSENLDLISSEDSVTIYNKVFLWDKSGSLMADKIDYNFETKYYHVSMFDKEKVKIKLIE